MRPVDQDPLQFMDENNVEWVEAWSKVVFKSKPKTDNLVQPVDQDLLQFMDENNVEWVEAWSKVVFKSKAKKEKLLTLPV